MTPGDDRDAAAPAEPPAPTGPEPPRRRDRVAGAATKAFAKGESAARGAQEWTERQDRGSRAGVAIGWFERYRESDGQLSALLLSAYLFVTVIPAALAVGSYVGNDPEALADRLVKRLDLSGATAKLAREVLAGAGGHQLTATLIAVVSLITFGLGISRTLQLIYGRAWRIEARRFVVTDQLRYVAWLLAFLGLSLLYVIQSALLTDAPSWIGWALTPLWLAAVVGFLVWTPIFLLHGRLTVRDVLPGALFATAGLGALRLLSSLELTNWLNWYSKYYGGIGIVMAIFFWIVLASSVLVVAAAMSPAYKERHLARAAEADALARAKGRDDDPSGAGPDRTR